MVNSAVMFSPLTNQEAVLSSRIEGTQATVKEVLEHEEGETYDDEKQADIKEILNYRSVLMLAAETLVDRPMRLSLLLQIHQVLMDSVRGANKSPGEFRKDQNWIGAYGCTIEQAKTNCHRIRHIIAHYEHTKEQVRTLTRSQHSTPLVDAMFERPIFRVNDLCQRINIKKPTLRSLINHLLDEGVIVVLREGAGRCPATLVFPQLLNIAEGKEVI